MPVVIAWGVATWFAIRRAPPQVDRASDHVDWSLLFIGLAAWVVTHLALAGAVGLPLGQRYALHAVVRAVVAAGAILVATRASGEEDPLGLAVPRLGVAGWGLALYLAQLPLLYFLSRRHDAVVQRAAQDVVAAHTATELVATFIALVLVVPAFEEIIHRGFLQGALRRGLGRWPAIACSALVFTAVHPVQYWLEILVLAVLLGYAYDRARSLWAPIAAHVAHNAIVWCTFVMRD